MKKLLWLIILTFILTITTCSCDILFGEHTCVFTEWYTVKEASCQSEGAEERYCIICFDSETRNVDVTEHTPKTFEGKLSTCTENGRNRGVYCSVCDLIISGCEEIYAPGHNVVIDEAVEPTENSPGRTEGQHCSVCGVVIVKQLSIFSGEYSNPEKYHGDYALNSFATHESAKSMSDFYYEIDAVASEFHNSLSDAKSKNLNNSSIYYVAEIYFSDNGIEKEDALSVWKSYVIDHPLYYWLSKYASCTDDYITLAVDKEYVDGEVRAQINSNIYKKAQEYIELLNGEGSVYQISLAFHDYLISNADYAYEADGITPSSDTSDHNILGVLLEGEGVCESYAKAFQMLLNYCGINNVYVTGYAGEDHAWNLVRLDNGQWYWYDLTWDDQPEWMLGIRHNYFCVTDNTLVKWSDGSESKHTKFVEDHISAAPGGIGVNYIYELPERARSEFEYDGLLLRDRVIEVDGLSYILVGFNTVSLIKIEAEGKVVIPESISYNQTELSVKYIGKFDIVNKILIPGAVIEYNKSTLEHTDITSISIPKTVEFIWDFALDNCYTINSFTVSDDNPVFTDVDGVLFTKSLYTLIKYPLAAVGNTYVIPSETKEIAYGAFGDGGNVFCPQNLNTLTIHKNVSVIGATNAGRGFRDHAPSNSNQITFLSGYYDRLCSMLGSGIIRK